MKQDDVQKSLDELYAIEKELALLKSIGSLLNWDMSVHLPKKAFAQRADQESYISVKYYELFTSEKLIGLIKDLSQKQVYDKLSALDKTRIDLFNHRLKKTINIPKKHVEEYSKLLSIAHHEWEEARKKESYKDFAPWLKKVYEMKKQEARYIDAKAHPYNIFLDDYERGITMDEIDGVLSELKPALKEIIEKVRNSKNYDKIASRRLKDLGEFSKKIQEEISEDMALRIIVDKDRFVVAQSTHPFMISISPDDMRITTGVRGDPFFSFGSTIHESGHALYESNFDPKLGNTIFTMDGNIGLTLHESQSRFWENMICKGEAFWIGYYPIYRSKFSVLKNIELKDFYTMINIVKPSLVRIEADELTYSMHVIIRYEIEKGLLEGKIKVEELEKVWNQKYSEYLGITPDKPSLGVLQDVHWANGLIGYFPTYALGSIYAAMLYTRMKKAHPQLEREIEKLDFTFARGWLKEKVHRYAASKMTAEIIRNACGKDLDVKEYIDYLKNKYYKIYAVKV